MAMTGLHSTAAAAFSLFASDEPNAAPRNQVAEVCLELLVTEIVDALLSSLKNPESDEEREAAFFKLEQLGYNVGCALVERMTRDRPRFVDNLDVVKFICKDLWLAIFQKNVDNLKTNHRGAYVLQDNNFLWFQRMSTDMGSVDASRRAVPYLWFPCGLIRGALENLGVPSVVIATTSNLPQCTFNIKLSKP